MATLSRRALGALLLVLAALLFAQPFALRAATASVAYPTVADPSTLVGLLPPALLAAGAVVFASGAAASAGRSLTPRLSLAAPALCAVAGLSFGVGAVPGVVSDPAVVVSGAAPFVVAGAVVGGALAPVTLGALKGDTVALLAGVLVLLVGVFAAPAPAFALVAGLLGGGGAVGLLWAVDAETWRP